MRVLWRVVVKEFLQLRRDRKMIPMVLFFPVMQLLIFGYAATLDVKHIPTLLIDRDRTASSRSLADRFTASGYFDFVGSLDSDAALENWFLTGKAQIAVIIQQGFGEDLAAGRTARVQLLSDGADANTSSLGLAHAANIVAAVSQAHLGQRFRPLIRLVPRVWFNPELSSRWFFVPAILAMVLMMMTMILPSMAVVREKEIGTLEQIIVTPVHPWQLILGKLLPFALIGLLDLFLVTGLAVFYFGIPLTGSLWLLVLFSLPFLVTMLGSGLFLSTLVNNQQQAMLGSMFFVMVPMIYLSGLLFPIENMPPVIQKVTLFIPLRYYANIIRGIFLKGSGFAALWPDALTLTAFSIAAVTLASLRFRKRLD